MAVGRICFIGASNVEGVGDEERLGWAGRLATLPPAKGQPVNFFNLGIGGETTDMIRDRWKTECAARLPDGMEGAIVMSFGLNDAAEIVGQGRRMPLEETIANVTTAAAEAKAWRTMVWVGPTPVDEDMMPMTPRPARVLSSANPRPGIAFAHTNERLGELNDAYAKVAANLDIPYMHLLNPLLAEPNYTAALQERDGLHPSGIGYQLIAEMIAAWGPWKTLFD